MVLTVLSKYHSFTQCSQNIVLLHRAFFVRKWVPVRTIGSIQTIGAENFVRHRISQKFLFQISKKVDDPFLAFSLNISFIEHFILNSTFYKKSFLFTLQKKVSVVSVRK